jgi:hypothetical protein
MPTRWRMPGWRGEQGKKTPSAEAPPGEGGHDEDFVSPEKSPDERVPMEKLQATDRVQLSVEIFGDETQQLRAIAKRREITVTDALRQCIATQRWIDEQATPDAAFILERGRERFRVVFR